MDSRTILHYSNNREVVPLQLRNGTARSVQLASAGTPCPPWSCMYHGLFYYHSCAGPFPTDYLPPRSPWAYKSVGKAEPCHSPATDTSRPLGTPTCQTIPDSYRRDPWPGWASSGIVTIHSRMKRLKNFSDQRCVVSLSINIRF